MEFDYKSLGLKAGIEIHQQINSHKMFCTCPSLIRDDKPDIEVTRKLRAVAGETGIIDEAAQLEQLKDRDFIYEGYSDSNCLVELDEEPPGTLNPEALDTVLQASIMLGAKPVDEVQVMRKTVIDGSNTSGFQRTALVARNGILETSEGQVSIPTISIEEDAARIIETGKGFVRYRLDRLGIPLIEIGTAPDIHSPQQVKETAEKLGMILRSTGRVMRGLGTIRQDVNISIKNGARIEIKGAQDLRLLDKLAEYEAMRQKNLLDIQKELKKRKASVDKNIYNLTTVLKNSQSKIIAHTIEDQGAVLGIKLKKFSGIIGKEVQPRRRYGTELSDYAKIHGGVGGIFHSDELPNYGITAEEVTQIKHNLKCKKEDAFVIVADTKDKSEKALKAVIGRASITGIPHEVRKAKDDATTSYLRPIPTAARMYPETDCLPIKTSTLNITAPELIEEKVKRYQQKYAIDAEIAKKLIKDNINIESLSDKFRNLKPAYIADTIISAPKFIKRKYNIDIYPSMEQFEELFAYVDMGKLSKESVMEILRDIHTAPMPDLMQKYEMMTDEKLDEELKKIVKEHKNLAFNALIGIAMSKLRGKAEGRKIADRLKTFINNR